MKDKRIVHTALATALWLVLLAGLALAQEPAGTPLGTAFTYQGQLKSGDVPYTGTCDIKFGLFDVSTGGTAISTLTRTNVAVDEGYLTVQLDYGSGHFAGDKRWLEMSVRCPAGSGSYTLLSPRQEVAAAPYALHAANADLLDGQHASAFAAASHGHWGAAWSGSGTGLSLSGGSIGLDASGTGVGVHGSSDSSQGTGVTGWASSDTGATFGVYGQSDADNGIGVAGVAASGAADSAGYGVFGISHSYYGQGVRGVATSSATGALTFGVSGQSSSPDGTGVMGEATASTGLTRGVEGTTWSYAGTGVVGQANAGFGYTHGVWGQSESTSGRGVFGEATAVAGTTVGVLGRATTGVSWGTAGWNSHNGAGVGAWSNIGDLIQAYDGDFPGGTLRFKVDQAGNVHLDGSIIYFGELRSPAAGRP
jgi:hypothetical protein